MSARGWPIVSSQLDSVPRCPDGPGSSAACRGQPGRLQVLDTTNKAAVNVGVQAFVPRKLPRHWGKYQGAWLPTAGWEGVRCRETQTDALQRAALCWVPRSAWCRQGWGPSCPAGVPLAAVALCNPTMPQVLVLPALWCSGAHVHLCTRGFLGGGVLRVILEQGVVSRAYGPLQRGCFACWLLAVGPLQPPPPPCSPADQGKAQAPRYAAPSTGVCPGVSLPGHTGWGETEQHRGEARSSVRPSGLGPSLCPVSLVRGRGQSGFTSRPLPHTPCQNAAEIPPGESLI